MFFAYFVYISEHVVRRGLTENREIRIHSGKGVFQALSVFMSQRSVTGPILSQFW